VREKFIYLISLQPEIIPFYNDYIEQLNDQKVNSIVKSLISRIPHRELTHGEGRHFEITSKEIFGSYRVSRECNLLEDRYWIEDANGEKNEVCVSLRCPVGLKRTSLSTCATPPGLMIDPESSLIEVLIGAIPKHNVASFEQYNTVIDYVVKFSEQTPNVM
jgi:hypothetical protein